MAPLTRAYATGGALATPDEGGRIGVPAPRSRLQPRDELVACLRMLPRQSPASQDALDRLRHIEPGAGEWCIEHHHPPSEEPEDQFGGVVTRQVVPDQEQAQWRKHGRQGDLDAQSLLPARP